MTTSATQTALKVSIQTQLLRNVKAVILHVQHVFHSNSAYLVFILFSTIFKHPLVMHNVHIICLVIHWQMAEMFYDFLTNDLKSY